MEYNDGHLVTASTKSNERGQGVDVHLCYLPVDVSICDKVKVLNYFRALFLFGMGKGLQRKLVLIVQ